MISYTKLLVNADDNLFIRKKTFKSNYSNPNSSHKKDKNSKNTKNQRENQSKAPEKPSSKKQKTRNCKKKEQLSLSEFTNKLNEYQDEFSFLQKKRNSDINIEKILSFQNNQNKVNSASINNNNDNKNQNNNSKSKKSGTLNDVNNKNINEIKNDLNKNNIKKEVDNGNSTLIIDFYKLYYHLFESNRLDNSKPYKFVDYLITGDNLLFNLKKDKNRFEDIKKGITIKQKNNLLINDQLLNKSIYEYLRCDFSNCFMKKIAERVNEFLMNRYIIKKKEKNSIENSISMEKKDKFTYSNFLSDKLKDNANKSCLSFTNDTDYIKSLIYVCNKYSKYIGKKEVPEKILIESLEKNKKILENFKNSKEGKEESKRIEMGYLKDLLNNKVIRKYLSKKIKSFNRNKLENNEILTNLDIDNFYKILNIIIKNKNDDDIDKLYKLFEDNLYLNENNKLDKNNLRNFIILLKFLFEISLANKINSEININNYMNESNVLNNISLLRKIYENISKNELNNNQKLNGSENNSIHISDQKIKGKSRIRIKKIKDNKNLKIEKKVDSQNKNSSESIINNIELNENESSNNIDKNSVNNNNNNESKTKKRNTKNSKIIPFIVPLPSKNNFTTKGNNNNNNNSLFEINNKSEINTNKTSNQIKTDEVNKNNNNVVEKSPAHFEAFNDIKKENIIELKEKEKNRGKKRRRRNIEENKENSNKEKNTKNEKIEAKIGENTDNNLINNCMTFYSMNQTVKKELNLGRFILNKLSSGQDIFKLIIEKPKIKRNKDKEQSENSQSKEKEEKEKDIEKEKEIEKEKVLEKENENELEKNIENKNDNNENNKIKKRRRRIKKDKTKEEDINLKIEEDKKKIKIENDANTKIKYDKGTNMDIEREESEEKTEDKKEDKNDINKLNNNNNEKEIIFENKEININNKKGYETRENSSKSKNDIKIFNMGINEIKSSNFSHKNEEERNIDIINFNNYMFNEGDPIKEITRNDLKHSPNICIKISQKNINLQKYKTLDMEMKDNNKKNNELIFNISNQNKNINNQNNKFIFSTTNKNYSNLETKSKNRKNKKVSFKNINIQIECQRIEIKGENFIENKKENQNEDIIKIKEEYFNDI